MKRFTVLIALLAMMSLLVLGMAGCGSSEPAESSNAVSGNWYVVEGSDVTTLKLDANGGGSYSGESVSYELSDDEEEVTLSIGGIDYDYEIVDDSEYGLVLSGDAGIFAYRDKNVAKEVAANGGGDDYSQALLGTWYMPNEGELVTMTFNEDGSLDLSGSVTITYTLNDDIVTLDSGEDTYDLQIAEDSSDGWVLKETYGDIAAWKDQSIAQTHVAATAPDDSAGQNAYVGNWVGESFSYSGIDMSLSEAGMTFSIQINADGSCAAMTNGESDGNATWVYNSDGTITLTDGTGTLPENSYIDESGLLHLALDADDGTMWIICHKE